MSKHPRPETPMRVERGIGWEMHLGDCLEVMATLDKVDHVITDPPYEAEAHSLQRRVAVGVAQGGKARGKRAGWNKADKVVVAPLDFPAIGPAERDACAVQFGRLAIRWSLVFCQAEAVAVWRDALTAGGMSFRRAAVWVKPDAQPQLSGDRPGMGYESIVCAHAPGRSAWNGGGRVGVFTHCKNDHVLGTTGSHPTQKPRALMVELVEHFTDPGETILDAFAGSGTTGVACLRLGRRFIGIEKDPKYFALACERLRAEESGSTLQAARAGQLPLLGGVK
jgi:site-specific DNA-methyltransferase (adenine-specific)